MESIRLVIALSLFGLVTSITMAFVLRQGKQRLVDRLDVTHDVKLDKNKKSQASRSQVSKLDKQLKQAGISAQGRIVLIRYLILQILVFVVSLTFFNFLIALLALSGIHFAMVFLLKRKFVERLKRFESQLCDAIQIISNAMKSGYSFFQALSRVVEDSQDPLASAFSQVLKDISLGKSMETAFEQLLENYPLEDLQLMVSAILIQKEIGGNLADILDNMLDTLRERQNIAREVKTLTAQGRLSGMIIVGLPIALAALLSVINPAYMNLLYTTSGGRMMLGIAAVSQLFGIWMIRNIVRIEY